MRKKLVYVFAAVMCMSVFTACGNKENTNAGNEVQQEIQAEDNAKENQETDTADSTTTESQTEAAAGNTADTVTETGEEKILTGTVEEIKDFMFIVTDDNGTSYELSFDTKPQGLDGVATRDKVKVTYTGELSEVDAFTGTIISVEKQ